MCIYVNTEYWPKYSFKDENIKFLKTKTLKEESNYKIYINIFEKLRKALKQPFIQIAAEVCNRLKVDLVSYEEIAGEQNAKSNLLPREIKDEETFVQNLKDVAQRCGKYFTFVGPNLTEKIPNTE